VSASQLVPIVLIVLVGYLLLVRPARRRAQTVTRLQSALSPGDQVMLTSGLFGTILDLQDEIARVELAPGIVVRVHRKAVGQVIPDGLPDSDEHDFDIPTQADDTSRPAGETYGRAGDDNPGVN
jgi:preprotein translocase subunit YajC